MSTFVSPPPSAAAAPHGPRLVALAVGGLLGLLALALALAGLVLVGAHLTLRDDDGFYTSSTERLATPGYAITGEGLDLGDVPSRGADVTVEDLGATVRVRAALADGDPVFVGIAPAGDVARYLSGVAHAEVTDVDHHDVTLDAVPGTEEPARPGAAGIWAASATGPGARTAEWDPEGGTWSVVVMRADGGSGVEAAVRVGARVDALPWIGLAVLALGLLVGGGAAALMTLGLRSTGGPPVAVAAGPLTASGAQAADATDAPAHPVDLRADLDEPLSRWLWIVKPLLVLPHLLVLAALWTAFVLLILVALVSILATGRYPRSIFDFNVGVLRWSWRVGFYAWAANGTDRYPPFSLQSDPDYPADLEVPYPERLSRGAALFKPWLLVLPHLLVLTAFYGWWEAAGEGLQPPGAAVVLLLVACVSLLVRGTYPRDVFRLLVGIARWTLRVAAYAALLRDEYPPFRLDP